MFSTKEFKKKALSQLKGNWTNPVIVTLLFAVIIYTGLFLVSGLVSLLLMALNIVIALTIKNSIISTEVLSTITDITVCIVSLLFSPLFIGLYNYFLKLSKNHKPDIKNLFDNYKTSFGNSILALLLMNIYISLWSLLFIIPGIIKSYAYSMIYFIIADNPKISANEAITLSRKMMKGHKWELFVLELSFIGWGILALFTCGIGYLWLTPYMDLATSHFYLYVKEDYENKNSEPNPVILEQF